VSVSKAAHGARGAIGTVRACPGHAVGVEERCRGAVVRDSVVEREALQARQADGHVRCRRRGLVERHVPGDAA
jgi:hypothetical protein